MILFAQLKKTEKLTINNKLKDFEIKLLILLFSKTLNFFSNYFGVLIFIFFIKI